MSVKIVCNCNFVTAKEIEKVMDKGIYLLEDIAFMTGASNSCGRCKPILAHQINQYTSSLPTWQTSIDWSLISRSIKQNKQ